MPEFNEENIAYPAPGTRLGRPPKDVVHPHVVVLFGATGDLARRKLLPGLARLLESALAPELRIVATSLDDLDDGAFREFARAALGEFGSGKVPADQLEAFVEKLRFVRQGDGPRALSQAVADAEAQLGEE